MTEQPVIEVADLWFSYNGQPVLTDVHLSVQPGDFMAVIGPNGGGKTTLIKLILGLLAPDRGVVRVFGQAPRASAARMGYVPQDVHMNVTFPVNVLDVVLMGRTRSGRRWLRYNAEDRTAAKTALERVEMWEYRNRRIGDLSGGQRQRVYLARALACEPDLLLLDEPTASVDAKGQTGLYTFLNDINRQVTIVVVSHDLVAVSSFVRSVACVNRSVFVHDSPQITQDMLAMAYHCPVELITHGRVPHRVLHIHEHEDH